MDSGRGSLFVEDVFDYEIYFLIFEFVVLDGSDFSNLVFFVYFFFFRLESFFYSDVDNSCVGISSFFLINYRVIC